MKRVYQQFTKKFTDKRKSLLFGTCKVYIPEKVNFFHNLLLILEKKSLLGCKFFTKVYRSVNFLFTRSLLRSLQNAIC